jgi:prolyl oligopeptidase
MSDPASRDGQSDPYRWLEDVTGESALDWVRERNADTLGRLAHGERFESLRTEILAALDASDRIPYVRRRGEFLYNFWQDADHPRGLWRRTTLASYRETAPVWDVLLDVDDLGAAEAVNWVWAGASLLRPTLDRALVQLSRGGADAAVVREFDLTTRQFVEGGFSLPEAKSEVDWIDRDRVYVGTDFGPGTLTSSGYPRVAKEWRRGTALDDAETVFEGSESDVYAFATHDPTPGYERDLLVRAPDFFTSEEFVRSSDGSSVRIEVPDDARTDVHRQWLLVNPRSAWTTGDVTHPAGSLLAAPLDAFLAGSRDFVVLFTPDPHSSLDAWAWTRHHLILNVLVDVTNRLELRTPPADGDADPGPWASASLTAAGELSTVSVTDTDPDHSDEYFTDSSGFLEPSTLRRGTIGTGEPEILKQAPVLFDATGLTTRQFFTTSDDGTSIPYFVVGDPDAPAGPTLMTGYGGFEVAYTPAYSGAIGRGWLARGGTFIVANIRGGGEYGPDWHTSAIRENRYRVYEDFAAVARDAVVRGITTTAQLGITGGSNGGLLMGVMLTRYPELFGAIVCEVPLLDMSRYHLLLAGASWMAEYGNPEEPGDWAFLGRYSPYQNVGDGPWPPVLFTTSTRDDRVHPGHARKMAALLRARGHHVEYYENIEGGHGGAADNEQRAFSRALAMEFLWQRLAAGPANLA